MKTRRKTRRDGAKRCCIEPTDDRNEDFRLNVVPVGAAYGTEQLRGRRDTLWRNETPLVLMQYCDSACAVDGKAFILPLAEVQLALSGAATEGDGARRQSRAGMCRVD